MKSWVFLLIIVVVVSLFLFVYTVYKTNNEVCQAFGYDKYIEDDGQGNYYCCKIGYNETFEIRYVDDCDWVSIKGDDE